MTAARAILTDDPTTTMPTTIDTFTKDGGDHVGEKIVLVQQFHPSATG